MKTYIFHGPSGSGKDTQIDLLENRMKFERIGGSFVMNKLKEEGHPLAIEAEKFGREGKRYPDQVVYGMFEEWLKRIDPKLDWVFVSPVRSIPQIQLFDDLVAQYGRKLDLFIHFTLPAQVAIDRLSVRTYCPTCKTTYHPQFKKEKVEGVCDNDGTKLIQREDDKPDAIRNRLGWYNDDIKPILDQYRSRGVLVEIDGTPSIDEIHKVVVKELGL